jgi:Protein of unknown function with HXXEE motif
VQFSAGEFRFAVLVLTIAAFGLTYLSSRKGKQSVWSYLLFGYIIAMLVNVFIPHVPATLILRSYTPGVITAVSDQLASNESSRDWGIAEGLGLWPENGVIIPIGIAATIPLLFFIGV